MVLFDQYKQLFKSPDDWRYYTGMSFDSCPLEDQNHAVDFIHSYFRAGEKESVIDQTINEDKLRPLHSLSAFFLGLLLKPLFNFYGYKPDFKYLWFLACLYHDYGYFIENDKENYSPGLFPLNRLLTTLKITNYNLLNTNSDKHFKKCLIEKYYLYCQKERQFINHGIVGGLLIYDRLKENFEKIRTKALELNPKIDPDNFCFKGLHWSSDHDVYYKKVANSILAHNIWYASDFETKESYRQYGLDALIIENEMPFSKESDPFLFLLVLADTHKNVLPMELQMYFEEN